MRVEEIVMITWFFSVECIFTKYDSYSGHVIKENSVILNQAVGGVGTNRVRVYLEALPFLGDVVAHT